jgi:hypothetical protein
LPREAVRGNPWLTPADEAELDVVTFELVRRFFEHRDSCETCAAGGMCDGLRKALGAVVEWREARWLLSKAAWLRRLEESRPPVSVADAHGQSRHRERSPKTGRSRPQARGVA